MQTEITCKIIIQKPLPGVVHGLQKGSGNNYSTEQKVKAINNDLIFECPVIVKLVEDTIDFGGPYTNGPKGQRFIYIDIGTSAGQTDSFWTRRIKVPLTILPEEVKKAATLANPIFETTIPGIGKDGGPNCATVKPFAGWTMEE